MRAFTFNPVDISSKREEQWNEQSVERKYSEWKSSIYSKVRSYIMNQNKTPSEWNALLGEIMNYNNRVERHGYKNIPQITRNSLLNIEKVVMSPNKKERLRAGEELKKSTKTKLNNLTDFKFKTT